LKAIEPLGGYAGGGVPPGRLTTFGSLTGGFRPHFRQAQSFRATVENVPVRLAPTVLKTVTIATETSAAIKPYSIAVAAF